MEKKTPITAEIQKSFDYIKERFQVPQNFDFIVREFQVKFNDGYADSFLIFYDGMANKNFINRDLMRSLLQSGVDASLSAPREETIFKKMTALGPLTMVRDFETVEETVTFGNCLLFVDGCACAFAADVKGWSARGVGQPIQEASLSGPQEAFNEIIMTNLALVRKILKTADLVAENIKVGSVSKTPCALLYLNGVTNENLVAEVRRRLEGIDTSYIFSAGDVEMMIEDNTYFPMTHILKTERPDRTAAMLAEGKVAVIVQGSPFALILPTTASDLTEAAEDSYVRVPEANFMRLVRLAGMLLSVLLPGLFIAIMLYHHEILPTDLLLAIEESREKVPFPLVAELILMELAFELIKEASIRVPSPVGSTLGIIGGLILGQAAVEAHIVSPILIIIVSIAGLGTFAAPTSSLARSMALIRFLFIIFGAASGLLGFLCALCITAALLAASESLGVPFLSPLAPKNGDSIWGSLLIRPIWKKEHRPRSLQAKDPIRQPHISRKWMHNGKGGNS
ncbi:spore germination protein [Ructibacterium gallinarum]|uniref:Spore germination protein n=1 Tax=Ructibacterium gallinarum TaxID=2779355 RepID=A0A9D5M0M3_9FIRM|nr:spore germination protein [Ructibacterium gallinarum]MBE5040447.1 spore germination protein [Ructibacterium gallinarum]